MDIPSDRTISFSAICLALFSVITAIYHLLAHQAPLWPTVLGQWLLLLVSVCFGASLGYGLQHCETKGEQVTIGSRAAAAYVSGAVVSIAYASHQYLTPVAEVGLDVIVFETVFTASAVGTGGVAVGIKTVEYKRALSKAADRERELVDQQVFTESIFDALPDIFYAFDDSGNFLDWNDRFVEVTGYSEEEIELLTPLDFVAEDDKNEVSKAITGVFSNDETVTLEVQIKTKDDELIPYEVTGSRITRPDGESLGLVGVGRDISQLREQRQRFKAVFNNTYQFIGLMETDGTLLEANETALEFGGIERQQVVGEKLWDTYWFHTEEARAVARSAVQRASEGELYRREVTVLGATGPDIIDFSVRPITDKQGNVTLLVPEGRLITDLKERERHLQVLHRFLRHNLRNKMTIIQGTSDFLKKELEDPEYFDYASKIKAAASDLIELSETAHELSQVAMEDVGEKQQPVRPRYVLENVRDDLTSEYDSATIELYVDPELYVSADWRLETVFKQLIENGIEHAGNNSPTVEVSANHHGDAVTVSIVDYGPGIPQDELSGIVTYEEQTKLTHGTGFGLWLVRSVVDDYGGDINYEPHPDGGSIVSVKLRVPNEVSQDISVQGESHS